MHATCMQHACNMHATCMQHAYNMHATCMQHALQHACNMHATCILQHAARGHAGQLSYNASALEIDVHSRRCDSAVHMGRTAAVRHVASCRMICGVRFALSPTVLSAVNAFACGLQETLRSREAFGNPRVHRGVAHASITHRILHRIPSMRTLTRIRTLPRACNSCRVSLVHAAYAQHRAIRKRFCAARRASHHATNIPSCCGQARCRP